ncbi:MAG TPA: hypothetical protein DCO75_12155 [Fibrobacteres bacterium]|jgi:hypothetical protein|nr:hypothetical protein [Fibrobacterota bacterium]
MLAVFITLSVQVHASTSNQYSDIDRSLFVLPRSSAVGTSDFVFSHDGTSQTNPANLAFDSISEASLAYAGFYQNTFSTSMLSYVTRIGKFSGIGFSIGYLYNPDISNTENLNTVENNSVSIPVYDSTLVYNITESEIYFHAGYGLSYPITNNITGAVGVGINALRYSLPPYKAYGLGCDGGVVVDFHSIGLKTSLICENLTTNYTKWDENYSETALPHVRFGIGWKKEIPYLYGRIQVQFKTLDLMANEGVNADSTYDSSGISVVRPITKHFSKDPVYFIYNGVFGLEYTVMNTLSLRFGLPVGGSYDVSSDVSRFAFGCGLNLMHKKLSIDFSYLTHELAGTYQIGISYRWNGYSGQ